VEGLASLMGECVCIPDSVLLDTQKLEDALETTLQDIDCALVLLVFLLNFFGILLSLINFIHDVFKLLSSRLELSLRGISDTI